MQANWSRAQNSLAFKFGCPGRPRAYIVMYILSRVTSFAAPYNCSLLAVGRPARPIFQNAITWATINIFGSGKKHLVALTALYKSSTIKAFFGHPQVRDPCPLKSRFKHASFFKYATWTLLTHCEGGGRSLPSEQCHTICHLDVLRPRDRPPTDRPWRRRSPPIQHYGDNETSWHQSQEVYYNITTWQRVLIAG